MTNARPVWLSNNTLFGFARQDDGALVELDRDYRRLAEACGFRLEWVRAEDWPPIGTPITGVSCC
jgi:hypothetical protein